MWQFSEQRDRRTTLILGIFYWVGHSVCPDASYTECGALERLFLFRFATTFLKINGISLTLFFLYKHNTLEAEVYTKSLYCMGLMSFKSDFEVVVKHSKETAFDKLLSYLLSSKKFNNVHFTRSEWISFTRRTSLLSYPIDFNVTFKIVDDKQTSLVVHSESGTIDWGKAKGMINDIVKEIY